ncbi:30S ribosome-binding factor RbfA [Myxococcota bacterium]|jgi:ribosome-binding factor A|nr:30S ribosome-binding factor RbfA [Myxococcota bacterium]
MSEKRTRRAAEVFHSELARLIREEVKDPRLTRLSITHVKVAEGIRHATVFVTPLGGEGDGKRILKGLVSASPLLRRRLVQLLHLKSAPALSFVLDEGISDAVRITSLLNQIHGDVPPERDDAAPATADEGHEE